MSYAGYLTDLRIDADRLRDTIARLTPQWEAARAAGDEAAADLLAEALDDATDELGPIEDLIDEEEDSRGIGWRPEYSGAVR